MKKLPILAALAALFLAAPALAQTYVMRHLNTPVGVQNPDLLPEGKATAEKLVAWFAGKPLAAIYVTDFKRTRQTAAPLAEARGLEPKAYDPRDTPALIARVKAESGPALIVGHSNTVPEIVEALGGERFPDLKHEEFGDIWTIAEGEVVRGKVR